VTDDSLEVSARTAHARRHSHCSIVLLLSAIHVFSRAIRRVKAPTQLNPQCVERCHVQFDRLFCRVVRHHVTSNDLIFTMHAINGKQLLAHLRDAKRSTGDDDRKNARKNGNNSNHYALPLPHTLVSSSFAHSSRVTASSRISHVAVRTVAAMTAAPRPWYVIRSARPDDVGGRSAGGRLSYVDRCCRRRESVDDVEMIGDRLESVAQIIDRRRTAALTFDS